MANKIFGVARWVLDADTSKLKRAAKDAKDDIKEVGVEAEKTAEKVDGSFSSAGESIEGATEGARKFGGAIGSTLGIITGITAAVGFLIAVFAKLKTKIDELSTPNTGSIDTLNKALETLIRNISGANDAAERYPIVAKLEQDLATTTERITEIRKDLDYLDDAIVPTITGAMNRRSLTKELDELQATSVEIRTRLQEFREKSRESVSDETIAKDIEKLKAFMSQLDNLNTAQEISFLPDKEQIEASADFAKEKFLEAAQAVGADLSDGAIAKRIKLIDEEEARKLKALNDRLKLERDAADERNRKEYESKMKAAEDSALAFANALDASTGNFTTRLDSILKEVRNVSRVTGRR